MYKIITYEDVTKGIDLIYGHFESRQEKKCIEVNKCLLLGIDKIVTTVCANGMILVDFWSNENRTCRYIMNEREVLLINEHSGEYKFELIDNLVKGVIKRVVGSNICKEDLNGICKEVAQNKGILISWFEDWYDYYVLSIKCLDGKVLEWKSDNIKS